MGAVAHRGDGRLGRADQPRDLGVAQLGMILQNPGDRVGLVLPLGDRRVFRSLALGWSCRVRLGQDPQARFRILFAAFDFGLGDLPVRDRIEALHHGRDLAVGDRLNFERMQTAKAGDLLEGQRSMLDQPHCGGLGHQRRNHPSRTPGNTRGPGSTVARRGIPGPCNRKMAVNTSLYSRGSRPMEGPVKRLRHVHTVSTILPIWVELSISRWASAASASGKVRYTTGLILPLSISGQIRRRNSWAMAPFSGTERGRSVEPVSTKRLRMT